MSVRWSCCARPEQRTVVCKRKERRKLQRPASTLMDYKNSAANKVSETRAEKNLCQINGWLVCRSVIIEKFLSLLFQWEVNKYVSEEVIRSFTTRACVCKSNRTKTRTRMLRAATLYAVWKVKRFTLQSSVRSVYQFGVQDRMR